MKLAARLLACALAPLAAACAPGQSASERSNAGAIVADVACNSCHLDTASAPGVPPVAPSWPKIAARWRGEPQAEAWLAAIIAGGTRERHWTGEALYDGMVPQAPWVTLEEARAVSRWILDYREKR